MQVLLLNSAYEPLKVISWKKAIILLFKQKAETIEEYGDFFIHSQRVTLSVPAVIRLYYYVNIRRFQNLRFSKENIFYRDNYTCVYCGYQFPKNQLTLDHVIPFSKGGQKTWANIVTACHTCNNKKGDRSPEQFGYKLMKKPKMPSIKNYISFYTKVQTIPEQWRAYLQVSNA